MIGDIVRYIRTHHRFAVTSHARPDGDSLGSELGLALTLEKLGKAVDVINRDPRPQAYASLPGVDRIQVSDRIEKQYDGVFVLECTDIDRPDVKNLENYYLINIDHHLKNKPFGNLNWVDTSAAAVGEMVYHLAKALNVPLAPEIASNLYVAIMTDTGSFRFSNTTSKTFAIVGELTASGADPAGLAEAVYMNEPYSKILLLGRILNTLEVHPSRRIAWIALTREMLEETGAAPHETEGIVNSPLSIEGVVMVAFFRQEDHSNYRVSLRSKGNYDVASVAERFRGGGHKNAAGLSVEGNFETARAKIISELEKLLPT